MEKQIWIKFIYKQNRDLLSKLNIINIYNFPKIASVQVLIDAENNSTLFSAISANILLFSTFPIIRRINKTIDKKMKNTLLGTQIRIPLHLFFHFFIYLKALFPIDLLTNNLKNDNNNNDLKHVWIKSIPFNLFNIFVFLYDKFKYLNNFIFEVHFLRSSSISVLDKKFIINNLILL